MGVVRPGSARQAIDLAVEAAELARPLHLPGARADAGADPGYGGQEARTRGPLCLDEGFAGNDQLKANAVQIFKTKGVTSFKTV